MRIFRSLTFKIVAVASVLAAIFLGATIAVVLLRTRSLLQEQAVFNSSDQLSSYSLILSAELAQVSNDTLALSVLPLVRQNLVTTEEVVGVPRAELQQAFSLLIESRAVYDQVRLLDVSGKEVVRVDGEKGLVNVISDDALQDKSNRFYFTETNTKSAGELFISYPSLNREGMPPKIEVPYVPTMRYATPVFDEAGMRVGVIVINLNIEHLLERVGQRFLEGSINDVIVADSRGYYVHHNDVSKQWGSPDDLYTDESISNDYGTLAVQIFSQPSFYSELGQRYLHAEHVFVSPVEGSDYLIVMSDIDKNILFSPISNFIATISGLGLLGFLLLFIVFVLFIRRTMQPIASLVSAAGRIGDGRFDTTVEVLSEDELGQVSAAFNAMTAKLQATYGTLEEKIRTQTSSLQNQVVELEHSKLAIMNVLEDVEEEKSKKDKLANDLLKFKLAVDNTSDMIVITDPQGIVLYGNKSVESITGYTVAEATGKKAATLWKTPMPEVFYKELWSTIKEKKQVFTAQVKNKRKSGEIYDADISVAPVLNTKGEIVFFVGIERDITAAMQVDRAKTEFVSLASHQLRTPLSAINWYTEMLLNGDVGELNTEQKQYLGEIYAGSQRMVDLVNALLNVSRLELGTFAVDPAEVVLSEVVHSVVKELQPQINQRAQKFTETCDPALPVIQADPKLVRIVVQNLLSNAVKYTPEKGEISITLSNLPKGQALGKRVAVEDSVGIVVKDNGMGIPVGQHGNIFDKLFRADNVKEADTEGTGLGLYIVKAIIEQAKGDVWFDSIEGQGTTFYIILPLTGMKQKIGVKRID